MRNQKILIYDSNASGHLPDFIEFILDFFINNSISSNVEYYFFLNEKTIFELEKNKIEYFNIKRNIHVFKIDEKWQSKINSKNNIICKSLIEKKYLESIIKDKKINELIFLQIDAYQLIIGLWQNSIFKNISISGILLHPYIQTPNSNNFKFYINKVRKILQLRFLLRFKNINNIFILNDQSAVLKLNKKFTNIFSFLPDPIRIRKFNKIDIREKYNIDANKKILLIIGGLQRRKNILNIIKAVDLLEINLKKKICLLILGKAESIPFLKTIESEVNLTNDYQIEFNNNFVDNNEFESAISESSLLFTVYSNFYCSSGILGNSAKHGKPVISSSFGVLGQLTSKFKLGTIVNPQNIIEISNAITSIINKKEQEAINSNFINSHNYTNFVRKLFRF